MTMRLGSLEVSAQGFGAMGLSHSYGRADDEESARVLRRAADLGVTLFDTAALYGGGDNETLVGSALRPLSNPIVIASKFAHHPSGPAAPSQSARAAVEGSLSRLGLDHIGLYYLHRVDPDIPIEESVGQLGRLADEGKIGGVGLCEVSADQIRRAHGTYPISAIQSEYSLWTRDVEVDILPTAWRLGIGFVAYSPLGRGFLAGSTITDPQDRRRGLPRFQPGAVEANLQRRILLEGVAEAQGLSLAQLSLAWVHAQGVVPIPGTRRPANLEANWAAKDVHLNDDVLQMLDEAFPQGSAVGDRYDAQGMALVPKEPGVALPASEGS